MSRQTTNRGLKVQANLLYRRFTFSGAAFVDWITLLIECVGVVILLLWVIIPASEFRAILARLRRRDMPNAVSTDISRNEESEK